MLCCAVLQAAQRVASGRAEERQAQLRAAAEAKAGLEQQVCVGGCCCLTWRAIAGADMQATCYPPYTHVACHRWGRHIFRRAATLPRTRAAQAAELQAQLSQAPASLAAAEARAREAEGQAAAAESAAAAAAGRQRAAERAAEGAAGRAAAAEARAGAAEGRATAAEEAARAALQDAVRLPHTCRAAICGLAMSIV